MELVLDILGWVLLVLILGGLFFIFYKLLSGAWSAFTKHDD